MVASNDTPSAKISSPFASGRVDHAGIRVPNFEEAVAWYREKLDFRLLRSVSIGELTFGFMTLADNDSFNFELLAGPGGASRPSYENLHGSYNLTGWHHIGIRVASVDSTVNELKRRGVKIVSEPHDVAVMGLRLAFFADPWDNLLEVTQSIGE